jgi:hypothetical protein
MKRYKTLKNLEQIWKQLDNASGDLYNALDNLADMVDLSDDIKRQSDMIDISRIDGLKQEIEALIEMKKEVERQKQLEASDQK